MNPFILGSSLKTRLMIIIGGITALLMMIISVGILFQWRTMIMETLRQNAIGVTQSIAISLTDAFVYGEEGDPPLEDLLERYIYNFTTTIPGLTHIAVVDDTGRILAHSDFGLYGQMLEDSLSLVSGHTDRLISGIVKSPRYGWVLETVQPLNVGGKRWGVVRVGFEAETARDDIRTLFMLLVGLTAAVTAFSLLALYLVIGKLTDSLHQLVLLMDRTGLESDEPIVLPTRNDEIGFLLHHFALLRKRLAQSRHDLLSVQQQIARAEKLASIGRLASGVAHEINNPLNGIKNCLYAVEKEPENYAQTKLYLQLIKEGMEYIETVVQKLLGFARRQPAAMQAVNMNRIVEKVVRLLDYNFRRRQIDVRLQLNPSVPDVPGDPQLLSEVVMNLLMNAIDAVEEHGRITIRTAPFQKDGVAVDVEDNGMGIVPEHLPQIFDPFFTTKGPKEGTGLGLSVTLGIVETHGGHIRVDSVPGQGSTFTIELPAEKEQR
jgi:two-component system, NtrC family, sensor kinase